MFTLGGIAWVGSIADHAVLPVLLLLRELTVEVESVVDVGEAEFDVEPLLHVS